MKNNPIPIIVIMMFEAVVYEVRKRESNGTPPINLKADIATVNPKATRNVISSFFTNYASNGRFNCRKIKSFA